MNSKKNVAKKYIFESIYIVIFIIIAVFVGIHHEPWADEAQSWLIARDNNVIEILDTIRYEGTPALWQFLLKFCQVLGLQYNQLYILTTTLTVIGIIFLHKNENVPIAFKILLPYTYYIFFQYTIVARAYTLLFPILMMILYIYPNKKEHLIKYGILLTLLMNISSHGFLLAGGFWFEFLVEEIQKLKKEKKEMPKNLKAFFITLTIIFIMVVIYVFPASDCSSMLFVLNDWYTMLSGVLFTSSANIIINIVGVILFAIVFARLINTDNIIRTLSLSFFNIAWIVFVSGKLWHIGIIFLIILSIAILNDSLKADKILYALLMLSTVIQIYWNASAIVHDFENPYSSGELVSEYLKELDIEDKKVYAIDFAPVQVNPYFEENIYENFEKSYYSWNINEAKRTMSKSFYKSNVELDADVYVIADYYYYDYTKGKKKQKTNSTYYEDKLRKKLEASGKYVKKEFKSVMYFKNVEHESTSLYVYSKK